MTTVGHLVNRTLSIPKGYESTAHIAVKKAEILAKDAPESVEAHKALESARGKVAHLAGLRPNRTARLHQRIEGVSKLLN